LVGHLQEIGDVFAFRHHVSRISAVLFFGGAEEDPVLAGHGVEVLSTLQRDGHRGLPLFVRSKDHVDPFAQAGDGLASGMLHLPYEVQPRARGVDYGFAPEGYLSPTSLQPHARDLAGTKIQVNSPQIVRHHGAGASGGGHGGERQTAIVGAGLVVDGV
jgi:hypothetical protein